MKKDFSKCAIVIPSYNEGLALGTTITKMLRLSPKVVIVVDDCSTDDTVSIVTKLEERFPVVYVHNSENRGQGYSLQRGIQYAFRKYPQVKYVVTVDADGQHHPSDVSQILTTALQGNYNIVYGVRDFTNSIPFTKKVSNLLCRITCITLYGYLKPDPFCGLRCYSREVLPDIAFYPRHEWNISSNKLVSKYGLRTAPVPIQAIYSAYSLQKGLNLRKGVLLFVRILRLRMIELFIPINLRPNYASSTSV